ncbi:MAG: hypothetical protein K0Q55_2935 [Verrucomicrobia bacterium]|jgi:hypothetical protein|nr:hypothetical protein [Verrucomicrobiota bacterium]
MKLNLFAVLTVAAGVLAGCGGREDADTLAVHAPPPPAPGVEIATQPVVETKPAEAAPVVPSGGTSALPPELAPVQQGLEAFKAQHNRLPNNVEEMVEKKIIPALPKLPVDKIYFIDHDTGRVMISSGP